MDSDIDRIISFWFDNVTDTKSASQKWFRGSAEIDAEIREQFSDLIEKARAAKLTSWTEQSRGTSALLLLLDQFPRNLFRGTPASFSSDAMALDIAVNAIAKGQHREVSIMQQDFFYLPLMHDEKLVSQIAAVALFENLVAGCEKESEDAKFAGLALQFCKRHMVPVMRFGRFPARNAILGRESTPEELEFLKEYPSGF